MSVNSTLIEKALMGDKVAIAKLLTAIEENPYNAVNALSKLWCRKPRSHVIGFTGSAGVGKSTLISSIALRLVREGSKVAILAVDPRSPFTGGALLGDRVRMRLLTGSVFIRSMSTREEESLPWKALLAIEVLEGLGYDYVIVETPGAGQFNVRVMKAVDTVVVVLMPGAGDEIQALKAGLMEIGDIYVINKADLPEAELTASQVRFVLRDVVRDGWRPKVLETSPIMGKGIRELTEALKKHGEYVRSHGVNELKRRERRELELELLVMDTLKKLYNNILMKNKEVRELYEKVVNGEENTVAAAIKIINSIINKQTRNAK